jgi:hypothetical protein
MGVEDVGRARQFVERLGGEAEGGDAHAEGGAEAAQAVGQGLVLDGRGVDQLAALRPHRDRQRLEEILAVGLQGWLDAQARGMQAERRHAEALLEREHGFIERHFLVGRAAGFPIDQHQLGVFPQVADGRVLAKAWRKGEGKRPLISK